MNNLSQRKILLIICGGISAYKSLELIRLLKKKNAKIKVILTESAKKFVTPLSVASLSQEKVYDDLFNFEIVFAVAGATRITSAHLDRDI